MKGSFPSNPYARAVYDGMVKAMRKATALSWSADYRCAAGGKEFIRETYKIWLQKPNYARMETYAPGTNALIGRLVLDGSTMWTYWPNGKPAYQWDLKGKRAAEFKVYNRKFYRGDPAPFGRHSIAHAATDLGIGCMTVLDPSTFHGYTDSMQSYIDGVRFIADKRVGGEDCRGIEVSIMKGQRTWALWLSKKDQMPRRLEETVHVNNDICVNETWSNVKLNSPQDRKFFAWKPPKGWKQYVMPQIEEGLLSAGSIAPDIDLAGLDGGRVKLSDYRGKVVWLNKWRCG
jgi:outer membrane lipoprotein-sorting protein